MEQTYSLYYSELTKKDNPLVMVYAIPKLNENLEKEGLSLSGFMDFIYNDSVRTKDFLKDPYFTSNILYKLSEIDTNNPNKNDSLIAKIKTDILATQPKSEFEYVFNDGFSICKADKKNLEKSTHPILWPNLEDKAIKTLTSAHEKSTFTTIIAGDSKTGVAWGECYDLKGRIGMTQGTNFKYPILVSFERGEYDEELDETTGISYDFLNPIPNYKVKEYLDENDLELRDVLDSGGGTLSDSIVAIKTGYSASQKSAYKHENFQPAYDIENAKIVVESFDKTISVKNNQTGETKEKTTPFEQFSIIATKTSSGEESNIFGAENISKVQDELEFQYEMALLNPKKADASKMIVQAPIIPSLEMNESASLMPITKIKN